MNAQSRPLLTLSRETRSSLRSVDLHFYPSTPMDLAIEEALTKALVSKGTKRCVIFLSHVSLVRNVVRRNNYLATFTISDEPSSCWRPWTSYSLMALSLTSAPPAKLLLAIHLAHELRGAVDDLFFTPSSFFRLSFFVFHFTLSSRSNRAVTPGLAKSATSMWAGLKIGWRLSPHRPGWSCQTSPCFSCAGLIGECVGRCEATYGAHIYVKK